MSTGDNQDLRGSVEPAVPLDTMSEFGGYVVNRLFSVGLNLDSARSAVGDGAAGDRIELAANEVDQLIRDIRTSLLDVATNARELRMKGRLAKTARALQATVLDTVALLEDQADTARQPSPIDYPAEIKRWRSFAHQAGQMARRWEQP
jgi:hypothetical protein